MHTIYVYIYKYYHPIPIHTYIYYSERIIVTPGDVLQKDVGEMLQPTQVIDRIQHYFGGCMNL